MTKQQQINVQETITRSLQFLAENQHSQGYFSGISFSDNPSIQQTETTEICSTALIGNALCFLLKNEAFKDNPALQLITHKIALFLKEQQQTDGSWNYWSVDSLEQTKTPYPNDLDDTALSFSFLVSQDENFWDGEQIAKFIHLLTSTEHAEGGPYNTWLTDFQTNIVWNDCDFAVNANIAFFLSSQEIHLPALTAYFEKCFENNTVTSKYYHLPITLLYFYSRSHKEGTDIPPSVSDRIEKMRLATPKGPLEAALLISTAWNFGYPLDTFHTTISYILEMQTVDHWQKEAFYIEKQTCLTNVYRGSAALTTAFCIEALTKVIHQKNIFLQKDLYAKELQEIVSLFLTEIKDHNNDFFEFAQAHVVELFSQQLLRESIVLPFMFAASLPSSIVTNDTLIQLGITTLYGWIGYTALDKVMDDECSHEILPFSTFCIRSLGGRYGTILQNKKFEFVTKILNNTEHAYYIEHKNRLKKCTDCYDIEKLPDQSQLPTHEKSFGHALSALTIITLENFPEDSLLFKQATIFFEQYLHARQYNDDVHDIIEDLHRGILTKAGLYTLQKYKILNPEKITYSPHKDDNEILRVFWSETFENTQQTISQAIMLAEKALNKMKLSDPTYFHSLLQNLKDQQIKNEKENSSVQQFLTAY